MLLDGVTTAYCYVGEGLPVNFDGMPTASYSRPIPTCKCMTACECITVLLQPKPADRCRAQLWVHHTARCRRALV